MWLNGYPHKRIIAISYGASLGWGNEKLLKWSRSVDQDGRHAHIWLTFSNDFSSETAEILLKYGASLGWGNEKLLKWSRSVLLYKP